MEEDILEVIDFQTNPSVHESQDDQQDILLKNAKKEANACMGESSWLRKEFCFKIYLRIKNNIELIHEISENSCEIYLCLIINFRALSGIQDSEN